MYIMFRYNTNYKIKNKTQSKKISFDIKIIYLISEILL